MSELTLVPLPTGWIVAAVRDVANAESGYGFPTHLQGRNSGDIPFAKVSDISRAVKESNRYLDSAANYVSHEDARALGASSLPPNTIVFAKIGGAIELNRRVILARSIIVDNNVMGLSPECGIEPLYLYYFMLTQRLGALARATTVPSLRRGDIEGIQFPLAPSTEQGRIADELDELFSDLDAAVAALERVRQKLKLYRASVLKAAVEGVLTAEWREQHPHAEPANELLQRILIERRCRWEEEQLRKFKEKGKEPPKDWKSKYKEPVAADKTTQSELPAGWCLASFDQIGETQGGLQKSPSRKPTKAHYPYLRVANVHRGALDLRELHRFELSDEELDRLRLQPGDLLIVEGNGSRTEIGRCAMWRGEVNDCVHQNHIIRVRPLAGVIPKYVNLFLNSPSGQSAIQWVASSTSGLYTLSVGKIQKLPLALPPTDEQEAIVETVEDHLSVIDHLEADFDGKLKNAQALRQSILRHAFVGQLMPQDPNDEPASELLKRIAAEREDRAREAAAAKQATKKAKSSRKKAHEEVPKKKRSAA